MCALLRSRLIALCLLLCLPLQALAAQSMAYCAMQGTSPVQLAEHCADMAASPIALEDSTAATPLECPLCASSLLHGALPSLSAPAGIFFAGNAPPDLVALAHTDALAALPDQPPRSVV